MEEAKHKNSVLPVSLQIESQPTISDLAKLQLYTTIKTHDDSLCKCHITSEGFSFRKEEGGGRQKVLSEWKFEDLIGIHVDLEEGAVGHSTCSIQAIGTEFMKPMCCGSENKN